MRQAFNIVGDSVTRARRVWVQQAPSFRLCRPPQFFRNVCCLFSPPTAQCVAVVVVNGSAGDAGSHADTQPERLRKPVQHLVLRAPQEAMCVQWVAIGAHLRFASSCSGVAGPTTNLATIDAANANAKATAGSSTSNWVASACHLSLLPTISDSATWARRGSEAVCRCNNS